MSFYSTPPKHIPAPALPTYRARDLMEDGDVAQIVLDDQTYTLRVTRAGKLILTKLVSHRTNVVAHLLDSSQNSMESRPLLSSICACGVMAQMLKPPCGTISHIVLGRITVVERSSRLRTFAVFAPHMAAGP